MSDAIVVALISAGVAAVIAIFGTVVSNRIALQALQAQAKVKKDELEEQAKLKKDELEAQARLKKDELEAAAARLRPDADGDRFAVSSTKDMVVMVETATGRTWLLHHSMDGSRSAWVPVERIDDLEEVRK